MKLVIVLLACACIGFPQTRPAEFEQARKLFYLGADGDPDKYDDARKIFDKLHSENSSDPMITVYYGSLRLVEASKTWALWKKNSLAKEGISSLDSAVAAAPDNLEIRFVRAATTFELPAFFKRREQSRADFDLLSQQAVAAAQKGIFDRRLAAASLYYRAEFLKEDGKLGEAVDLWEQARAFAPGSRAARDSLVELRKAKKLS